MHHQQNDIGTRQGLAACGCSIHLPARNGAASSGNGRWQRQAHLFQQVTNKHTLCIFFVNVLVKHNYLLQEGDPAGTRVRCWVPH